MSYICYSLQEAKKKVEHALADDFDTPKAIQAMEELIHRTNVELNHKLPAGVCITPLQMP